MCKFKEGEVRYRTHFDPIQLKETSGNKQGVPIFVKSDII